MNNQNSYIALDREDPDGVSRQTADRETKGWQDYLTARMRIAPAPKSHLLLSGYIYRYGFHTENDVRTKLPGEDDFTKYAYHSTEAWGNRQWNVLYKYEINANHYVYIKGKYLNYLNRNETEYIEKGKVRSGIKEYSAEGVYERNNLSVFAHRFDLTAGYKTVFRKYELDRAFFISQNIHSVYGDLNARLGNGLSMSASLFAEYTRNANEGVRHTYHHILPVFSILYQLPYQTNIRLSYSKKITRPAADYLNRNPIVFNPLYVLVGNPGLLPQERYSYGIGVTQNRKGGQVLSLNMLHNRYTNLISETLTNDGERIVNSYENLGNAFRSGLSMGFYTKLFGGFTLNTNGGINYHYFSSASGSVIVNENKGFSCNANINLGASLGKGFLVNLSGIYNSKDYSLAATSVMPPIFLLNVQTRLFRDKWKVEWNCFDLFATYSQTKQYIHAPGFSQTATTTNNMFNMELKMTYRFGKVFDDNFGVQGIRNDDIIMK